MKKVCATVFLIATIVLACLGLVACGDETPASTAVYPSSEDLIPFMYSVQEFGTGRKEYTITALKDKQTKTCVIPYGVHIIGESAFQDCTKLESVSIPRSVKKIGQFAFKRCTSLKQVLFPEGPYRFTDSFANTFEGCTSLESIVLPSGVTDLGSYVFKGCTNLRSVVIPDSVTEMFYQVFAGCYALEIINYTGTKAQWENIHKSNYWNQYMGDYVIYCTDGALYM